MAHRRWPMPLLLLLSAFLAWAPATAARVVAVTFDDLPWVASGLPDAVLGERHRQLMAQLDAAGVPVTGFVNEGKLDVDGRMDPLRARMLEDWLDRGHALGNHTRGHVDLHAVGLEAFQRDVLDGERWLRPALAARGERPRWFRHPYLRAGRSAEARAALDAFLSAHGYRVAPVTVDNSDWLWAAAYRNVLDGLDNDAARERVLARLRADYVPYMLAKLDYYQAQAQALLGRPLAQVWLLHANELNAATFARLVAGARERGYRFVALDEAMRDEAYVRGAEGYDGPAGPSWIHRWAIGEGRPGPFFAGEPVTPAWVVALAGFDSE